MQDVEGKTAFITGGASGMGLGMATVFARAGMKVVIADIRQEALDEAMAGFKDTNLAVHPVRLDVTDRENWVRAADEAERVFGPVHVLVNNAGVGVVGPMQQATYDDWDFVLGVCLGGVVNGVQTFLPRLRALAPDRNGERGHIVNNSSQSGAFASGQAGLYITAKMGVAGLSEALATDLQNEGVGVSVYFPGPVATNLGQSTQAVRPGSLSDSGYKGPRVPPPQLNGQPRPNFDPAKLREVFMDPIEVGERVLRGIRRGDLFIFSHPEFREGMQARHDAIMRAIPDEPVNAERKAVLETFGTLLYNPIYEKQTTPGPLDRKD
jgi:NAD(P)-dependent dehydrogenase (short-subunit alcohol dehydrogenase family)